MSQKCCGCWSSITHLFIERRGGRYRRVARYNEREYTIEFENLIEEEDFYAPPQHAVTDKEKELLAKGKFEELLQHENKINAEKEELLRQQEENARLEDEVYIQAKREASRVSRQGLKKQPFDKSKLSDVRKFNSAEFSKWLSEESIDITSPELDIEDFDAFLEKVKAKSAQARASGAPNEQIFEQTLAEGLQATKIAGDALSALQPVELHAVSQELQTPSSVDGETTLFYPKNNMIKTVAMINTPSTAQPLGTDIPLISPSTNQIASMGTSTNQIESMETTSIPNVQIEMPSFKMVTPVKEGLEESIDPEDEFISASNESGFEELLT